MVVQYETNADGLYNHHLFKRFIGEIILSVVNGDIRNRKQIQYYAKPGSGVTKAYVIRLWRRHVIPRLLRNLKLLHTNRWVKGEQAVDWPARLSGIHGLLAPAYCDWAESFLASAKQSRAAVPVVPVGCPSIEDTGAVEANATAGDAQKMKDWREEHMRHVRNSLDILCNDDAAFSKLLALRLIMEPHAEYQYGLLHVASVRWRQQQEAQLLCHASHLPS
jgi:hypothetical protein